MRDITAIIPTKDEELNIRRCIESVRELVSRIIVVDSGSKDRTVKIASELGVETVFHEFEYSAKQWNWAFDSCNLSTKWVLRIDADEAFTPELCQEVEWAIDQHEKDDINGFWVSADYFFMGRKLHGRKKKKLIIFKTGMARMEDRRRDAHMILSEGTAIELKNAFEHHDFKDLDTFVRRYNWYATREAQDYVDYAVRGKQDADLSDKMNQKKRNKKFGIYYKAKPFHRAFLLFIYNYYLRGGWRDGKEGMIYHVLSSFWYRFLVDAKIYEYMEKGKEFDELKAID